MDDLWRFVFYVIKITQKNNTIMGSILDAINAAAASLQGEYPQVTQIAQKSQKTVQPIAKQTKAQSKAAPKTDTAKTKGGAKYVIPKEFKQAIEDYLNRRDDMANKLKNPEKSMDGCCEYIYGVMLKRAEKQRGGARAVGLYADPNEIFGLAVHYYDETNEDLEKEK